MNLRKYGNMPYEVAVIHGGPGAVGSMKSVAKVLSKEYGVLEPLQTKMSVEEQIEELKIILEENTNKSITLIGHSWGAMLIYMFASKYTHMVNKIIMVSSGSVEEKFYPDLCNNREERLSKEEKEELNSLRKVFDNPKKEDDMDDIFKKFG